MIVLSPAIKGDAVQPNITSWCLSFHFDWDKSVITRTSFVKVDVGHNNEHVNVLDEFLKRYTQEKSKIGKRSKNYKHLLYLQGLF